MKAIYTPKPDLYVVVDDDSDSVLLEPVGGDEDQRIWVDYSDPSLILDPTDGEIEDLRRTALKPNAEFKQVKDWVR